MCGARGMPAEVREGGREECEGVESGVEGGTWARRERESKGGRVRDVRGREGKVG